MQDFDLLILGAGASGLFCALTAAQRGLKVGVLEHMPSPGKKILASGGGRANFTNLSVQAQDFRSLNPHFAKSALAQYPPKRFLEWLDDGGIEYHEKKLGQLFCNRGSKAILDRLIEVNLKAGVQVFTNAQGIEVALATDPHRYKVNSSQGDFAAPNLVVATGGLSYRVLGASDLGHQLARQFGLKVTHTSPALVPFILPGFTPLAGISLPVEIKTLGRSFADDLLFTHQGLSGPAILKASLFWDPGKEVEVNLLPGLNLAEELLDLKRGNPQKSLFWALNQRLPERLVLLWQEAGNWPLKPDLQSFSQKELAHVAAKINRWSFVPKGTEGYIKAEVTQGGVSTDELSSKTLETKKHQGLYFIGEVIDVTGLLGGYNLHWAWASGFAAGRAIKI
ncbi:MAG: hypothetical protein A2527_01395 [Candidatus Lambdaproteobacteria bacterium RIFOXYD2_FULL_50_16]|uniref:Uncharacterized protein n=1 Tax=Candidatus Lambdaproteobacteria bacterium RIFOXYD2_FULL_50_16 TaxID=1817772 RepID=A0A1F6G8Q0_9PROT|nr:MAG: hypothetical protein A2527_01395 [Candidatus Lambdaproteobacteria bacterium RIFOXYD2_FULL_50_16]